MSLVRQDERFRFERLDGVYFLMADGGTHVLCKVSQEALRDRSARDGVAASLPDTFVRHRERIETIAGEKYAQDHRPTGLVLFAPPPLCLGADGTTASGPRVDRDWKCELRRR